MFFNNIIKFICYLHDILVITLYRLFVLIKNNLDYFFTFIAMLVFYFPSLINKAQDAGHLYTGDVIGFYWPSILKLQSLYSKFNFVNLDFSHFNGSGDFTTIPNMFSAHPFFVIFSLLSAPFPSPSMTTIGFILVLIEAIHCFLACLFTIKLWQKFFNFSFLLALFAGVFYAFSVPMLSSLGEPMFLFVATCLPIIIYLTLRFEQERTFTYLIIASSPVVLIMLSGYLPLAISCLFLACLIVSAYIINNNKDNSKFIIPKLIILSAPCILGIIIVSPFIISSYINYNSSPSNNTFSLFYSAHQLSELPHNFLRIFSKSYFIPGPFFEFSVQWGLIPVFLFMMFIFSKRIGGKFSSNDWAIFKFCGCIYAATLLSIYGPFSPISDLVYYFVPKVGGMHIYQRFLLPCFLILAMIMTLLLKSVSENEVNWVNRLITLIVITVTFYVCWMISFNNNYALSIGFNEFLVFELICCLLFAICCLLSGSKMKQIAAIVLVSLPSLSGIYMYSHPVNHFKKQLEIQPNILNKDIHNNVVEYMKQNTHKKIIKYIDLTPMWKAPGIMGFPRSFPYIYANTESISSYSGFNFYLSPRADYMTNMGIDSNLVFKPNWEYLKKTGADFVIAPSVVIPALRDAKLISEIRGTSGLQIANNYQVLALKTGDQNTSLFDNGYFRVIPSYENPLFEFVNLTKNSNVKQSGLFGNGSAEKAIDGNMDGNYNNGSVTHTNEDINAWLELDLKSSQKIDTINIYGRTDCCSEKLQNYWVFVSEKPYEVGDKAEDLLKKDYIQKRFVFGTTYMTRLENLDMKGRYVRVQLDGTATSGNGYLSIAEIQVLQKLYKENINTKSISEVPDFKVTDHSSNGANYLTLSLEANKNLEVSYQFWHNPGLKYYINGKKVTPLVRENQRIISLDAGKKYFIEVRYNNFFLSLFWLMQGIFLILLIVSFIRYFFKKNINKFILTAKRIN